MTSAIDDLTDTAGGVCIIAEQVADQFHAIDHLLAELRERGATGTDAELIERYQALIAAMLAATTLPPLEMLAGPTTH